MGKYSSSVRQAQGPKKTTEPHAIWRGIGFVFFLLAPILGYFGALTLIQLNKVNGWYRIPSGLYNTEGVEMLGKLGQDPLLFVKALLTVILAFLFFALMQFISFMLYGMFGPKRYGPLDVPPVAIRNKKKSR